MASTCPICGERIRKEMQFCPRCGKAVSVSVSLHIARISEKDRGESELLGRISVGVILVIIAIAYMQYPLKPSTFIDYLHDMVDLGTFIKPPLIFFDLAIFFFYALGVWNLVLSGLRIVFQWNVRKALSDLSGGLFAFLSAFILDNYAVDLFTRWTALGYFIAGIGCLIVVRELIGLAIPMKK